MGATSPLWSRKLAAAQERFQVIVREPWGRIERIADGVWALVSDPMRDRKTICNGGIIAGSNGVVVIEAFGSDEGAVWMSEQARLLTGRMPTHVVLTHYHSDHTGGLRGMMGQGEPELMATPVTRDDTRGNEGAPNEILSLATPLDMIRPTEIDLGDRSLVVVPRRGHTDSDVTIELTDPAVIFCGDLVWNGMVPNYRDATPSRLTQAVRLLRASEATAYVPGHGALADAAALDVYLDLLDDIEAAARLAMEDGRTAEEAGAAYRLPSGLADWTLFNRAYFEVAIGAWMRELGAP